MPLPRAALRVGLALRIQTPPKQKPPMRSSRAMRTIPGEFFDCNSACTIFEVCAPNAEVDSDHRHPARPCHSSPVAFVDFALVVAKPRNFCRMRQMQSVGDFKFDVTCDDVPDQKMRWGQSLRLCFAREPPLSGITKHHYHSSPASAFITLESQNLPKSPCAAEWECLGRSGAEASLHGELGTTIAMPSMTQRRTFARISTVSLWSIFIVLQ